MSQAKSQIRMAMVIVMAVTMVVMPITITTTKTTTTYGFRAVAAATGPISLILAHRYVLRSLVVYVVAVVVEVGRPFEVVPYVVSRTGVKNRFALRGNRTPGGSTLSVGWQRPRLPLPH